MNTKTQTQKKEKSLITANLLRYFKATLVSFILTFALIIIFAFVIKWASIDDKYITPVNMAIKAISIFIGSIVLTKNSSKGLIQGLIFAGIYTILAFSIFSILAGKLTLGLGLASDLAFGCVVGAIGGMIGVNRKKKD